VNQAGGFFRVPLRAQDAPPQRPNVQLYFNPLSYQVPDTADASLAPLAPDPFSGFLMGMHACRPTSRGEVRIASPDPDEAPRIDPRYLSTAHDEAEAIAGARLVERLLAAPALTALTVQRETAPPADAGDAALLDHVRGHATSIYHLCGSCAMGPDPRHAVVDAALRVHGVPGLRVVDASVFPNITSGNTQAAVMMLAERGAALLRTPRRA
jgi:choline dehydrogenase